VLVIDCTGNGAADRRGAVRTQSIANVQSMRTAAASTTAVQHMNLQALRAE